MMNAIEPFGLVAGVGGVFSCSPFGAYRLPKFLGSFEHHFRNDNIVVFTRKNLLNDGIGKIYNVFADAFLYVMPIGTAGSYDAVSVAC